MTDNLIQICETQMGAILKDVDSEIKGATDSASRSIKLCRAITDNPENSSLSESEMQELHVLRAELDNVIRRLQFHDELSQRLEHLHKILGFMKGGKESFGQDMSRQDAINHVSNIFSTKAEFDELGKLFPDMEIMGLNNSSTGSVELF